MCKGKSRHEVRKPVSLYSGSFSNNRDRQTLGTLPAHTVLRDAPRSHGEAGYTAGQVTPHRYQSLEPAFFEQQSTPFLLRQVVIPAEVDDGVDEFDMDAFDESDESSDECDEDESLLEGGQKSAALKRSALPHGQAPEGVKLSTHEAG